MAQEMRGELRHIESVDIDDLATYRPPDSETFSFSLYLDVGVKGKPNLGSEMFSLIVCTPKWFYEEYTEDEIIIGRHYLFVFKYDYGKLYERIRNHVNNCRGQTWTEVAEKVGRLARWEFEDYQP